MSHLTLTIDAAVKAQMSEVHAHADFMVASECVRLHFGAIEGPADGKPDTRTTGQIRYSGALKRHRIEVPVIEKAVESLLGDSLGDDFLRWSARVIAEHPRISTEAIAQRLQEIMVFVGTRSLAATEAKMDSLVAAEEKARVVLDKNLSNTRQRLAKPRTGCVVFKLRMTTPAGHACGGHRRRPKWTRSRLLRATIHARPFSSRGPVTCKERSIRRGIANPRPRNRQPSRLPQNPWKWKRPHQKVIRNDRRRPS